MQFTNRQLNRTLWLRQHLASPSTLTAEQMVEHLIGLQAQENLPPYLSLSARIKDFDPLELSDAIADRRIVRFLTMRGTVHALTPDDALALRPWVQPMLDRISKGNQISRPAAHITSMELYDVVAPLLKGGPTAIAKIGEELSERFPAVDPAALRNSARERVPMLQVPPRGLWKQSGGVVYQLATTWLGRPHTDLDLPGLVRRYLRAYGPATAADMTKWSTVTRLGPIFKQLDDLELHRGPEGQVLYDVQGAPVADESMELPTRLLGNYDNVWLSHANRQRIVSDELGKDWLGPNGAAGSALFVDGFLAGWWRLDDGDFTVWGNRSFTKREQSGLDSEVDRVRDFLAR